MNDISPKVPRMDAFKITEEGIRKLLSGLNTNKAAGPDNLETQALKELADVLAPMVTLIYNVSTKKQLQYSKGEKYKASNYRSVSLMCPMQMYGTHCGQSGDATTY